MTAQTKKQENPTTEVAKQQEPMSVRFMNMVVKEFTSGVGEVALTNFQKRLAQNYFIATNQALSKAEAKRQAKTKNKDPLPIVWANVNMEQLALDVVAAARVGLDPAQKNHISMVPYKNNNTNKYDIGFIDGYRGIEMKACKYGLDVPSSVTVELVYANDHFKPIKKDTKNRVESYEFDIPNPFDRGEIVGGFYYHAYNENPTKNKLVMMTLKEILKRKPTYASTDFWGGEKDEWVYDEKTSKNKKTGNKIQVDGWFEKMCLKTVFRAAFGDITIDSQKIDDDYLRLKQMESSFAEQEIQDEIDAEANGEYIDVDSVEVVQDAETETVKNEQKQAENAPENNKNDAKTEKSESSQQTMGGGPNW
ncbi:MAG: recombinational DNA repair protein (RecE pathway) [Thermodesulfobacteriota bacterium]|nr:recombinational DNA repair protein (RecE pathway) [Thermodesulfobacteriota bacterium]